MTRRPPAVTESHSVCANCGAETDTPYCPQCGQRRAVAIRFSSIWRRAIDAVTDLDSGLLYTFRRLTLAPGRAIRDYIDGQRSRYTNPLKYAFISTTTLGLATFALARNVPVGTPTAATDLLELTQRVSGPLVYVIIVASLGVAALQRIFFPRAKTTVAEWYVFQLFVWGHLTWLNLAWVTANTFVPSQLFETGGRVLEIAYLVWALRGYSVGGWVRSIGAGLGLWTAAKVMLIATLAVVVYGLSMFGIALIP